MIFKVLWNEKSAKDIGTLYQLRCATSRTNVSGDVKHEMNWVMIFFYSYSVFPVCATVIKR